MGRRRRKHARERQLRRKLKLLRKTATLNMARGWIAEQVSRMKEGRDEHRGF